jgi:predicted  nucleic acid-binding Zn-ribbon protein
MKVDTNFYIDRTSGFPIVINVINGIVQEFDDHEYHGHLSSKTVGKHISELKEICTTKLYKTWLKNFNIGQVYNNTGYNNLEWKIHNLKRQLEQLNKTIIVRLNDYYRKETEYNFNERYRTHELTKTQAANMLATLEAEFEEAKEKVRLAKLQVFNEHGIQF